MISCCKVSLNVKGMLEAKGFEVSKGNIADASWGNFVALLTYRLKVLVGS